MKDICTDYCESTNCTNCKYRKASQEEKIKAYEELVRYKTAKYYNYDYVKEEYYSVVMPSHDHYTYCYEENAWYEDVLINNKGYTYKEIMKMQ